MLSAVVDSTDACRSLKKCNTFHQKVTFDVALVLFKSLKRKSSANVFVIVFVSKELTLCSMLC